ncbi:MAG: hypothetical protein IT344_04100, partial [Candidatus Dadabacteria bacterium]|nr:hypothetical protein [Candidatus Dadabacteria bacterium]
MKELDDSPNAPGGRRLAAYILLLALAFKLAFILYSGGHVYYDVNLALTHGKAFFEKPGSQAALILPGVKTYVGSIAWYRLYDLLGVYGLKAFNLAAFALLFAFQYAIGRRCFPPRVTAAALFIFSFYAGTNLNVAAGEQDDMTAALFFTLGVVLYTYGRGAFLAALVMSAGLLFKYTAGIYAVGFIIYLIYIRDTRQVLLALGGLFLPFLCLNLVTGFSSMEALLRMSNLKRHFFFSPPGLVLSKFFSTGMFLFLILSVWAVLRDRSRTNALLFCLSSVYIVFAVATFNTYSSGFHMMQSVLFSSFLAAEVFLMDKYPGGVRPGRLFRVAVLVLY